MRMPRMPEARCTGMQRVLVALAFSGLAPFLFAQPVPQLWTPDMPIDALMNKVPTSEVPIYLPDTSEHHTYLPNGFRKATILEQDRWLLIRDEVDVERVRIIFSKYPTRNGVFDGHYWLTRDRLIELFRMDPELNREDIAWEVVLHTDCRNDRQVATLFHGIEITHRPRVHQALVHDSVKSATPQEPNAVQREMLVERLALLAPEPSATDPAPIDDRQARLMQRLDSLAADTSTLRGSPDQDRLLAAGREQLTRFTMAFGMPGDSVVWKVLDRHPAWKQVVVVADWTGSMYGYGAQALDWHTAHFDRSGLVWFTLFNDGNATPDHRKKVGSTGGLYDGKADNIKGLMALYQLVMMKGSGGDGPENPLEAVLHAMERYPDAGEIVLIADNNACVRDMELLELVDVPLRVVVCGATHQVNEQLLNIALATNGSLHTMEEDLHNAQVERNKRGDVVRLPDLNMKFAKPVCEDGGVGHITGGGMLTRYGSLEQALKERRTAEALDISDEPLQRLPRAIGKLEALKALSMNRTGLATLDGRLLKNDHLRVLEMDGNDFTELPAELAAQRFLVRLNARDNRIAHIAPQLANLQFLKELDLSDNPLGELPDAFPSTRMEVLKLANTGLTRWPAVLKRMRRLKHLDLSGNTLDVVTLGPGLPRNIEVLDLASCTIAEVKLNGDVPATLRVLDLTGVPLSPEALTRLRTALPKVKVLPQ
ncbi:MAG: leucine-rich repeat domain-containing protein [Flavobacteriales bacterium]|nr:leucine-rich repeat domain-containing protein [Flavobacteriales bacterium]